MEPVHSPCIGMYHLSASVTAPGVDKLERTGITSVSAAAAAVALLKRPWQRIGWSKRWFCEYSAGQHGMTFEFLFDQHNNTCVISPPPDCLSVLEVQVPLSHLAIHGAEEHPLLQALDCLIEAERREPQQGIDLQQSLNGVAGGSTLYLLDFDRA